MIFLKLKLILRNKSQKVLTCSSQHFNWLVNEEVFK